MRRPLLALFAAAAAFSAERAASAGEPVLDLSWEAPVGCPDGAQVIAHVEELVGRRPAAHEVLHARARVSVAGAPRRYTLELAIGEAAGSVRTMAGDDCSRLADAAALVLALDIDPDALSRGAGDSPSRVDGDARATENVAPSPPAAPSPREPPARPRPRALSRERALDAYLGARVLLDTGSLPRSTLGLAGVLEIGGAHWAAELGGLALVPQLTVRGPRDGAGGAYVSIATATLHGCVHGPLLGDADWRGCAGGELGRESTRGVSIRQPATSASTLGAVSAMARVRFWPKLVISPTVGVALGHPIQAPRIVIAPYGTVFEGAGVFFRGFLGLEAQFL